MFVFANGAKRSPDAAWIAKEHWETVPPGDRKKFPHIAPDFVVELRSETDRLAVLQAKSGRYRNHCLTNQLRFWSFQRQYWFQLCCFSLGECRGYWLFVVERVVVTCAIIDQRKRLLQVKHYVGIVASQWNRNDR